MATRAQIKANGNNVKKSTGPRSEEGKARVAKNALKHGLLARDTVLPGEDPEAFDSQLAALEAYLQPANSLEFELVRRIADTQWRMRRLVRLETGFLAAAVAETRRLTEKYRPEKLRPGYDGETRLLGSAMLERTQVLVHLAPLRRTPQPPLLPRRQATGRPAPRRAQVPRHPLLCRLLYPRRSLPRPLRPGPGPTPGRWWCARPRRSLENARKEPRL